jgi:hypothetical protein
VYLPFSSFSQAFWGTGISWLPKLISCQVTPSMETPSFFGWGAAGCRAQPANHKMAALSIKTFLNIRTPYLLW